MIVLLNPHQDQAGKRLALARAYLLAKQRVIDAGYEDEVGWQESVSLDEVTARTFVREAAWVVLSSGMRESVVRSKFTPLGRAFADWDPNSIIDNESRCIRRARRIFNHAGKLEAIVVIAAEVVRMGVDALVRELKMGGPETLMGLPYIGPATCFHLAKNLGCAVAKPDRHLKRMAAALGFSCASGLCTTIAEVLDEPVQLVDLVMWRYATIDPEYLSWLRTRMTEPVSRGRTSLRRPEPRRRPLLF